MWPFQLQYRQQTKIEQHKGKLLQLATFLSVLFRNFEIKAECGSNKLAYLDHFYRHLVMIKGSNDLATRHREKKEGIRLFYIDPTKTGQNKTMLLLRSNIKESRLSGSR